MGGWISSSNPAPIEPAPATPINVGTTPSSPLVPAATAATNSPAPSIQTSSTSSTAKISPSPLDYPSRSDYVDKSAAAAATATATTTTTTTAAATTNSNSPNNRDNADAKAGAARGSALLSHQLFRFLAATFRSPLKAFRPIRHSPWETLKDRVKANQSLESTTSTSSPTARPSTLSTLRYIASTEGNLAIVGHVVPTLILNVAVGMLIFQTYERSVQFQMEWLKKTGEIERANHRPSYATWLLPPSVLSSQNSPSYALPFIPFPVAFSSGFLSGVVQALLSTPTHNFNRQLSLPSPTTSSLSPLYPSFTSTFHSLLHEPPGLRKSLFHGFTLLAFRDSIGLGIFFSGFEIVKRWAVREEEKGREEMKERRERKRGEEKKEKDTNMMLLTEPQWRAAERVGGTVAAGVVAGSFYRVVTHPMVSLQYQLDQSWIRVHSAAQQTSSSNASSSLPSSSSTTLPPRPTPVDYLSAWPRWKQLIRDEGFFWYWKRNEPPLGTRLSRIFNPSVIGLVVYELTKDQAALTGIAPAPTAMAPTSTLAAARKAAL